MAIEKEVLDQLLAGHDPRDVFGKGGLVDEPKKAPSERILNAEIDDRLAGESAGAARQPPRHRQFPIGRTAHTTECPTRTATISFCAGW